MRNDQGGEEYAEHPPVRRCGHCGAPLLSQRRRAKYCDRRCKELAREARKRASDRLITLRGNHPFADVSLAELHDKAGPPDWRDDPRNFSDYGDLPDDFDLAAEIDDEHQGDERARRYHAMLQEDADQRTPRETWKRWRSYGRRYGTEHPEQTADRIERHQAGEAARMARIDRSTAGRIQDRFDKRTSANVAQNAIQSRALNARPTEQPPLAGPGFDFQGESFNGGPYRSGLAGQRSSHAAYSWRMEDGFRF